MYKHLLLFKYLDIFNTQGTFDCYVLNTRPEKHCISSYARFELMNGVI